MNEEIWDAIIHCDAAFDGKFFYGVDTTRIFCRPSCKSKNPKRENVRIFLSIDDAVSAEFRPCKRCRPDHLKWPDEDLVRQVMEVIERHYGESLTLSNLADLLHVSPYHLQRTFKRLAGQTPSDYLRELRLKSAERLLTETSTTITDIAMTVGFPNAAHFSTVFGRRFGVAPSVFRSRASSDGEE